MAWAQILTQTLTNWVTLGMFLNLSLFHFPHIVKGMVFPEVMYRCESWTVKKNERWRIDAFELWTVVLEKTLETPLDCKEIKPVNPKGNQPWIFTGGTDAEVPILWPPDVKSQLIRKDSDAEKDWRQQKGTGWDGWMASVTQWTWVWARSRNWWWTGKPGVLQFIGHKE